MPGATPLPLRPWQALQSLSTIVLPARTSAAICLLGLLSSDQRHRQEQGEKEIFHGKARLSIHYYRSHPKIPPRTADLAQIIAIFRIAQYPSFEEQPAPALHVSWIGSEGPLAGHFIARQTMAVIDFGQSLTP
jgi:hypothetical protein